MEEIIADLPSVSQWKERKIVFSHHLGLSIHMTDIIILLL
jgi:hypothetical protein